MKGHSMHDDISHVLLTEEEIQRRVAELGAQLSHDYANVEELVLIWQMEFMGISSYGNEHKTSGIVRITKDIDTSINGKHVLIAEDIMDSGLTLAYLKRMLAARNPASLKICCLLDKPSRRECAITPDYCGFVVQNKFVVGYGLDYVGLYRNLPYVGVLKPSVYAGE